jgi:hypothetical protein
MNNLHIIIAIFFSTVLIPKVRHMYYMIFTRLFFPNRILQDKVRPLVDLAIIDKKLFGYEPSEFTDIQVLKVDDNLEMILVELFLVNKSQDKWNVIEKKMKIKGLKDNTGFKLKSVECENSKDIGKIIPDNSSKFQNSFFKSRKWDIQKKNFDEYKKYWSQKHLDDPNFYY